MSKLDELIQELCPDGVEYKRLSEVATIERGKRVVKEQLSKETGFPVFQNSLTSMGYHKDGNYPAETSFVIGAGAAGEIGYSKEAFWAADDVFRLSAETYPQTGQVRLAFCGGTSTNRPPRHASLYSCCRLNSYHP